MKKWYILIKKYPGSPKLGTLVYQLDSYYSGSNNTAFNKGLIENQPEYWEELPMFYKSKCKEYGIIINYYVENKHFMCRTKGNRLPDFVSSLIAITKQEYLDSFGFKIGDIIPNNIINAWCQKYPHKVLEDIQTPYWDKSLNNPNFGFTCVVRDLDIMDNVPVFIIGSSYAISLEGFKEFISSYKPKLTFGGHEVVVDGKYIAWEGEVGTLEQLKLIKNEIESIYTPKHLPFGNVALEHIITKHNWEMNFIIKGDVPEDLEITIGCTTGTWKELCDIIKYIEDGRAK